MLINDLTSYQYLLESTSRTLYHGTLRKFIPDFSSHRLWPDVGAFTRQFYGDDYEDQELQDLVFAADKDGIRRCFSAISAWINIEYGANYTVENFARYGALCVLKDMEDRFTHRTDDEGDYHDHPDQVEPGDYYSDSSVTVTHILTGKKMMAFFAKYGGLRSEQTKKHRDAVVAK